MPPHGRRRMRMNGTTVAGLVNSSAQSDEEARRRVTFFFGSILAALFLVDVGCALLVVYLQCQSDSDSDGDGDGDGDTVGVSVCKACHWRWISLVSSHRERER
eukprot:778475_1